MSVGFVHRKGWQARLGVIKVIKSVGTYYLRELSNKVSGFPCDR